MALEVDHVTWAGGDLDALRERFGAAGLASAYGGLHGNGVTHMAVVGFPDGSYIELLAPREPGARSPIWEEAVRSDAGPAAWAARCDDIGSEADRLRGVGISVRGPEAWARRTPSGREAAWSLAFPGEEPPGSTLPFLIEDRTPRSWRVEPTEGIGRTGLSGVREVVLLVGEIAVGAERFRGAYDWPPPLAGRAESFGAALARFEGTPVCLAAPLEGATALSARLRALGPAPCAFLLQARDREAAAAAVRLGPEEPWPGGSVRWVVSPGAGGRRLGIWWGP